MLKNIFYQIVLFLVPFLMNAQSVGNLERAISSIPAGTKFSIMVLDADRKSVIFEQNSRVPLKPASCIKVFTTGAALLFLGKDFKISTSLFFNKEKIRNGVLNGHIYIKGFGNPLLSYDDLDRFVKVIQSNGIKKINGNIIYDNSFFIKEAAKINYTPVLSPLQMPALSPVSINRNIIELVLTVNNSGVSIKSVPASKNITFTGSITRLSGMNNARAVLEEKSNRFNIILNGNLSGNKEKRIYLYVKQPELLTSLLLHEKLENAGILLTGFPRQGILPAEALNEISFPVLLSDLIKDINKNSNNYFAETVKRIFNVRYRQSKEAANTLKSFLASSGIDTRDCVFADGSGISVKNRITAKSLVEMLHLLYKDKNNSGIYKSSLSIAGVDGTLKEEYPNSPVKNNFRGKSGYLNGVSSICGYMRTPKGRNIIIAIIINYKSKEIDFYRQVEKNIIETVFNMN